MRVLKLVLVVLLAAAGLEAAVSPVSRRTEKHNFELEEVLNGSFSAKGLGAVWVSGNQLARYNTSTGIHLFEVGTEITSKVLVESEVLAQGNRNRQVGTWVLSKDRKLLLWSYEQQSEFRHSTTAKYSILDIDAKEWFDLKVTASGTEADHLKAALLSGEKSAFFVDKSNTLYYVPDINSREDPRIVCEGKENEYYCGIPDWVYEEEVLSSGTAMWLSKGDTYLAYGVFDDTLVKTFTFTRYRFEQYTEQVSLKYPKPGTANPVVRLEIVKRDDLTKIPLYPPNGMEILQHVAWTSDSTLLVVWMSRIQNKVIIQLTDVSTQTDEQTQEVHTDTESAGWLEIGAPIAVNETTWVQLLPVKNEATSNRFQRPAVFIKNNESFLSNPRTTTDMVATALYGWNEGTGRIFFQAAPEGLPAERHVYSTTAFGAIDVKCLTCNMSQYADGETCLYASASFSTDLSKVAVTCSGPGPAVVRLGEVQDNGTFNLNVVWEDNKDLRENLQRYNRPEVESKIDVPVAEGFVAKARLWLPHQINRSGSKKYPMLVYVYGGPGSQQVSDAYSINWGTHLTVSKDIIYALIDGRGSGFQGTKNMYTLYKRLGTVEVLDQISVVKELVKRYSFIDEDRIGIWGWSYGGYATAMALAMDTDEVFKCGASVAPVTSWDLYDSIYTERYMDELNSNRQGYEKANISNKIDEFKNHNFFLLHGNADDNVHYQQAMHLARALQLGDILFYEQSYPDENHSIRSVITHVYKSLGRFFDECFEDRSSATMLLPSLLSTLILAFIMRILS